MACAAVLAADPDPRGDFPAWLATRGMKPTFADAMERELGISDYEELLACAEDAQVTAELLGAARDRLPFAFYAVLRRLVRALTPRQRQRWWWRQRRRSRSREPLSGNGKEEERARDDDGGGDEEEEDDEEPGGCASGCEGVLASRAVLDAIVATLSSLSRELLRSAQRFRCLEPAPASPCGGRRSPRSPGSPDGPSGALGSYEADVRNLEEAFPISDSITTMMNGAHDQCSQRIELDESLTAPELSPPPPPPPRTSSRTAGVEYKGRQFDSHNCFGQAEPCVAWREIKLERDDDGRGGGDGGDGFSPRCDGEAEVAMVAERAASGAWLGKTEHEEDVMAHWQAAIHSHGTSYEEPADVVPQHAPQGDQSIPSGIPDDELTGNWTGPDTASLDAPAAASGDNSDIAGIRRGAAPCSFQCRDCGATFAQRQQLRAHRITHTTSRPYCCRLCGKGFTKAYNLTVHMRTHTGEKPFLCSQCNATFRLKHHLQAHQKTHASEGAAHHAQQAGFHHHRPQGHLKTHPSVGQRTQVVAQYHVQGHLKTQASANQQPRAVLRQHPHPQGYLKTQASAGQRAQAVAQHHLVQVQLKTQASAAALSGGGGPASCSAGAFENTAF
ncbi:zinc finger and BTB domain-containing protein 7B-like [Lethenteron reissneri]|uniref:zinc finger and BTB domain-containing protein 7B-like n=1 Tax=Lethenteron reissneri TaxID=7753 RepID=UPI002AB61ECB|nr:zinc finger and BTB domain-containing protein 7B-like [Lethenteron reissneri]